MKLRVYIGCRKDKSVYAEAKALGAIGVLTNSTLLLSNYGEDMTLKEMTKRMLDDSGDMLVFQSIQGDTCEEIVDKALDIYELSDRVGFKIASDTEGFKAMKALSDRGIRVIATEMFTFQQAYMAAVAGCYAVSPFFSRGNKVGYDMEEMIRETRSFYDRLDNPPEILAASIHTVDEIKKCLLAGADSTAIGIALLKELCEDKYSNLTKESFAAAFSKIKGETVSEVRESDGEVIE